MQIPITRSATNLLLPRSLLTRPYPARNGRRAHPLLRILRLSTSFPNRLVPLHRPRIFHRRRILRLRLLPIQVLCHVLPFGGAEEGSPQGSVLGAHECRFGSRQGRGREAPGEASKGQGRGGEGREGARQDAQHRLCRRRRHFLHVRAQYRSPATGRGGFFEGERASRVLGRRCAVLSSFRDLATNSRLRRYHGVHGDFRSITPSSSGSSH